MRLSAYRAAAPSRPIRVTPPHARGEAKRRCLFLPTRKMGLDPATLTVARCAAPAPLSIDFSCPLPSPSSPETRVKAQPLFLLKKEIKQ